MSDAYAIALIVGMPLYAVFMLTRIGSTPDEELHPVRALVAAMVISALIVLLFESDRFF